jgi:Dockerin type I domain
VFVNLTGVANAQIITVTLVGVNDGTNTADVSVPMGVLLGDVNGSGVVTSGDTNICKSQALQPVTNANFRSDVNASGAITTGDVNIIKQNALTHL